jgi:hypothetical protein
VRPVYDDLSRVRALRLRMFTDVAQKVVPQPAHRPSAVEEIERAFVTASVYHATNVYDHCNSLAWQARRVEDSAFGSVIRGSRVVAPHPSIWIEAKDEGAKCVWAWLLWQTSESPSGASVAYEYAGLLVRFGQEPGRPISHFALLTFRTEDDGSIRCSKREDGQFDVNWNIVLVNSGEINGRPFATTDVIPYGIWLLFTLGFLNCRNVIQHEWTPTRQMVRSAQRSKDRPPVTFRTIEVTSISASVVGRPKSDNHPGVAKHIQRGHFKRYTEDRPLFGRFVGQYWWEQHLRGQEDRGEVQKDYAVLGPHIQ